MTTITEMTEREQFLSDVLTTAVEGGINYWAAVSEYRWHDEDYNNIPASVTVHEMDDYDGNYKEPGVPVTTADISKAIAKIIGDETFPKHLRRDIFAANIEDDAGDIDADLADVIMQVAVLGAIVYG